MHLVGNLQKGSLPAVILSCAVILATFTGTGQAEDALELNPAVRTQGIVLLTPGSSTSLDYQPGYSRMLVPVVTFGPGTLRATLEKDDTRNELVGMYLMGYPADPPFLPGFGITPATVSVSTEVSDVLGGAGFILILTTINSSRSYAGTLSLSLD